MIDFRYHLVSIASIFLALAVGIVLGAGPLRDSIGSTLTQEVTKLRQEKADLRAQLDRSSAGVSARDDFIKASGPALLSTQLRERKVALVVLPGVAQTLVGATRDSLTAAGATVTGTVEVQDAWLDPTKTTERDKTASSLAAALSVEGEDPNLSVADRVLAAALAEKATGGPSADKRTDALEALRGAGLIALPQAPEGPADTAVVLGASATKGTTAEQTDRANRAVAVAEALDARSAGAVVAAGAVPTTTEGTSVVAAARKNAGTIGKLSTVDDAGTSLGQASVVLALAEQLDGGSGQYGLADDARAAFPPLPTTE
ncbi:MAG: copper transporter [Micrococcales bacterium]|nr:copper transporter [Micrococcales bacterium]